MKQGVWSVLEWRVVIILDVHNEMQIYSTFLLTQDYEAMV